MMPAPHEAAPDARLPLTRSQLLLWTGQQLHPEAPLYNMVLTFTIDGPLDVRAFEAAFQSVVERCDALRTVIEVRGGEPVQVVRSAVSSRIECLEMPEEAVADWVRARARRPFDLGASLFDTVLIRVGPARHVWYLDQHHLVTDGWSVALVYRYVSDSYERALAGTLSQAPSLPTYGEYVAFESTFRESPVHRAAEAFWKERLASPAPPARLYGSVDGGSSTRTTRYTCALGAERSSRLKALASQTDARSLTQHLSQFNLFAAALLAFVHRVSGQRDLALGTPSHNRPTAAFKETVGLFIEVFPLRARLDVDETFASLFRKVRAEANLFLRHALPGTSTAAANRSFNVLLNYITASFPAFAGMPTTSEWVHAGHGDDRHQLRLQVHDFDAEGQFLLHFDFNDASFPPELGRAAMRHFLRVVDAMLDDPAAAIRDVDLVTEQERDTLIARFGRSTPAYRGEGTVLDRFRSQVVRAPDVIAVAAGNRTLTYGALDDLSKRLAARLRRLGIRSGRRVGLLMERSVDVLPAILGIMKSGAAYVPLDPAHPENRIALMLEEAGAEVVVAQPDLGHLLPAFTHVVHVGGALPGGRDADAGPSPAAEDEAPGLPGGSDLAYVLYTSGSTGRPKGVPITHESLAHYVSWAAHQYLDDAPGDFPLFTPLTFDLTVTSLFVPLVTGGRVVVYPDSGNPAATVLQVFADDAVDVVKLTPSHLRLLADRDLSESSVRALIVGGEDLKTDLARRIVAASGDRIAIYNEYGPTEATVGCTIYRFDPAADRDASVPIGRPAASARIYVLDDGLQLLPAGVTGEIYVGGPGLAQGYLDRPDLTAERFVAAPHLDEARIYRTGDLGRWRADGTLEYLGRIDHQVKIRGVRIELGEIEAALAGHPAVRDAVVDVVDGAASFDHAIDYCVRCGLPSNYPGATFDAAGLCNLCRGFPAYEARARQYFRGMDALQVIFEQARARKTGEYDCLMLLSGGKDSTYALYQVAGMGMKVLAFTLDNGYLSEGAKANIRRVTKSLGVDHVFGETPAMKAIFADSLRRHSNVCNGCFKTIYTLGIQLALEKGITHIVTGLSRGQFFETRLTEELFQDGSGDAERIDLTILEARKAYHRADDAVSRLLDVRALQRDELFEQIQFVDFYRYCDVDLDEMLSFLDRHAPWIRPADTGRSTNCLINDAGIYVHKLERGFHNYAFPYSWDVRMGHKTRDEALAELNDEIDVATVSRMLDEVGYTPRPPASDDHRLVAYYVSDGPVSAASLRAHLARSLPDAMIPSHFVALERMPLNANGKVDRAALPRPDPRRPSLETTFLAPRTPVEERIASLWEQVLQVDPVGVTDEFVALGGNSLLAIQIIARVNHDFGIDLAIHDAFVSSTVGDLASLVERTLLAEIEALPEEEARRLAGETIEPGPAA